MMPSILKIVGGLVVYFVFFYVDMHDIWPQSHLQAIALGVIGTVGLLFYETPIRIAIYVSVAVIVAGVIAFVFVGPAAIPEQEVTATIVPGDEATPPDNCNRPNMPPLPPNTLKFFVGDNVFGRVVSTDGRFSVIRVGNCDVLGMTQSASAIPVDGLLYTPDGKLIAHLQNNSLTTLTGEMVEMSHEGSLNTIRIKYDRNIELLYINYLNHSY